MRPELSHRTLNGDELSVTPVGCTDIQQYLVRNRAQYLRHFDKGNYLLLEGEQYDVVFVVISGWLTQSKSLADGETQIIDFAMKGDVVDPASADRSTSSITIEALTEGTVAAVPFESWEKLMRESSGFRHLAQCIEAANTTRRAERMLRLGKGTAETRLAYAILELCVRLHSPCKTNDPVIHLPMTQQILGDFTGLSSVHVCRTFRRMIRAGILGINNHIDIRVYNPDALAELAGISHDDLRNEIIPR